MQYLKEKHQTSSLLSNGKYQCVILIDHRFYAQLIPDMFLIYMHFMLKHYYNYYTRQVHFQWKLTHYNWSTSKFEHRFLEILPQFWQHLGLIGRNVKIIIITIYCYLNVIVRRWRKLNSFSVFVCQDIFALAYLSCRSSFLQIFAWLVIHRLLLASYQYYLLSSLPLTAMAYHLSQQLWVLAD